MTTPIIIPLDELTPTYPYEMTLAYSPPHKWSKELVEWMDPDGPDNLSGYLPKAWANTDISQIPALVPPPPTNCDSEISDLYALKALRPRYLQRMRDEDQMEWDAPFCEALARAGVKIDAELPKLPGTIVKDHIRRLRKRVHFDAGCIVLNQKALFNRARPWQLSPGIQPIFWPPHPAYPSGHSTQVHVFAWVMEAAFKEVAFKGDRAGCLSWLAERYTDCATSIARRREIAGVHYSSDTVAGMTLATRIVGEYLNNANFKREFFEPLAMLP